MEQRIEWLNLVEEMMKLWKRTFVRNFVKSDEKSYGLTNIFVKCVWLRVKSTILRVGTNQKRLKHAETRAFIPRTTKQPSIYPSIHYIANSLNTHNTNTLKAHLTLFRSISFFRSHTFTYSSSIEKLDLQHPCCWLV